MTYRLKLKRIERATHDTHHLIFDRPEGFAYAPGQGVELFLVRAAGWEKEGRPFTPVSLPDEPDLEFVIKAYTDHDGMTAQVGKMAAGDEMEMDGPFGALSDQGPGVFIAGGAGVTPMIAILRQRLRERGTLKGSTLIFANKTEADIIWRDRFEAMTGLKTVFVVDEAGASVPQQRLDREFLAKFVDADSRCYLCGPPPMMTAVRKALNELGVKGEKLIEEEA
ncbi:FAD-binding oxidoreductase [Pikeienuella sp. HZG-20]|uniref:FAD-binding oxidoreductase n=1 Tax=Paludibacillus litoralis TaxID=3133267 RepID=UPI0030EDD9CF